MKLYIRNTILVVVSYFVFGKLSLLLTVPPGYVTPVFLPSGIALATLLLLGMSYTPAIWIGSFLMNFNLFLGSMNQDFLNSFSTFFLMASGATLLPITGALLIKRFLSFPNLLSNSKDVFKFLLLGGPVSCITSATIGTSALLFGNHIQPHQFLSNWWSWWIGDSLGVIILCPLVLIWFSKPKEYWVGRRLSVTIPIIIAFFVTTTFYIFISKSEQKNIQLEFRKIATKHTTRIQKSFDDYAHALFPLGSLVRSKPLINQKQFEQYTRNLLLNNPNIDSVSWVEWLEDSQKLNATIRLISPLKGNKNLLGFDLASVPANKILLQEARDKATWGTFSEIPRASNSTQYETITIFRPIYFEQNPFAILDNKKNTLRGFVCMELKVMDVMQDSIKDLASQAIQLSILKNGSNSNNPKEPFFFLSSVDIFGKGLTLKYTPTAEYFTDKIYWGSWVLLTVALLFNGLLGAFLLIVTGNKLSVEKTVKIQTQLLREHLEQKEKSEENFRLLISAIKDYAIIMLDKEGNISSWNDGAEKIMGYQAHEIIGKHFSKFYPHEALKTNQPNKDLEIVRDFDTLQTEQWRIRKDAVKFIANTTIAAIKNSSGQLLGYVQVIRDLTDYKNKEAILKKSEELYRNLFNSAQDIVAIAKFNGTLLSINPAFETLTGWSREEWIGKSYRKMIVPEDLVLLEDVIEKVANGYTPPPFECRIYTKNNKIMTFESTIRPILEDRKPATKSLIISRDVTYRKYSEELVKSVQENLERQVKERTAELTASNEKLQKVNCELEKFTSIASHDLKEPLRTLSNYISLLADELSDKINTRAKEYIKFSIDATRRMQRLVSDLLNYSMVDTSKEKFKKVNIQQVLNRVLRDLQVRIEENNALIQVNSPLPSIFSDETQIAQLFQNLIDNALKYRSKKPPIIEIFCTKKQKEWYFSVKDNGIGFDMKYAEKIFQAFHRLHERDEYPGTGIGLAICKKIIDRHHGKIWVESHLNQGSTFHFAIPIKNESNSEASRILYADDSNEMRISIKQMIETKEVFQVDTAKNGEECIQMALKNTYDLILMDIQMPRLDGTEATIELRKQGFKKPIIAFTGHYIIQEDNKSYYQKFGFTDYFSKNDDMSTLSNFIEKYVTTA